MHTSRFGSIEIKEKLKAGSGDKALVIEGFNIMKERVTDDVYIYIYTK
jgi:hypothetical protein